MQERITPENKPTVLISLAALIIIFAGLHAAKTLVVPFLLACFIALVSAPLLFLLKQRGYSRLLSMTIVFVAILTAGAALVFLAGQSVDGFNNNIPVYKERLQELYIGILHWFEARGLSTSTHTFMDGMNPSGVMGFAGNLLNGISSALTNAFLIILTVIFILSEIWDLPEKLNAISPEPETAITHFYSFCDDLNRYIGIKTLTSLLTGFVIFIWLSLLGVDFPILWGLLAFVLNFVPNIGSIIAAIPAILLALIELGAATAAAAAIGYGVVNIAVGSILEPRLMGYKLGLSTLVVFLSLVLWGWLLGPVGMFLSVPLTMIAKIAMENNESTRWMGLALGPPIPHQLARVPHGVDADSTSLDDS